MVLAVGIQPTAKLWDSIISTSPDGVDDEMCVFFNESQK